MSGSWELGGGKLYEDGEVVTVGAPCGCLIYYDLAGVDGQRAFGVELCDTHGDDAPRQTEGGE